MTSHAGDNYDRGDGGPIDGTLVIIDMKGWVSRHLILAFGLELGSYSLMAISWTIWILDQPFTNGYLMPVIWMVFWLVALLWGATLGMVSLSIRGGVQGMAVAGGFYGMVPVAGLLMLARNNIQTTHIALAVNIVLNGVGIAIFSALLIQLKNYINPNRRTF